MPAASRRHFRFARIAQLAQDMAPTASRNPRMKSLVASLALAIAVISSTSCSKPAEPTTNALASSATILMPASNASVAVADEPNSDEPLAWMAGSWCGKDEDQVLEETWMMPAGGETIGTSRTISGGRIISFEFMRIAEFDGTQALVAQPGGDEPVHFKRSDGGADWIRFENKEHDYPQRIEYRKAGDGLRAEIGGPGAGGKEEVISYEYVRCAK
jgi:hypothetical protein